MIESNPPPSQVPYDPSEIIRLMNDIYTLLAKMRYLKPDSIIQPPHKPLNIALAKSLGIDPVVIDLMQKLPYVSGRGSEDNFFYYGGFAGDCTRDAELEQSRDPLYLCPDLSKDFDEEDGPYLRPWVMPLNDLGNRGSIIFFDTRTGHVRAQSQSGGCADPAFYNKWLTMEHNRPKNNNSIEHLPSRPAVQFFRDFTIRLHTLEWIPFDNQMHTEGWFGRDELEILFRTYGWPDNFDGPGFDIGAKCYKEFCRVRSRAHETQNELKQCLHSSAYADSEVEKKSARVTEALQDANMDGEQLASLKQQLGYAEDGAKRASEELATAKEAVGELGEVGEDVLMQRAWESQLQGDATWLQRNIDFFARKELEDGKPPEGSNIEEAKEQMKALKAAISNAHIHPKTLEDAIRPGRKLVGLDIH